MPFVHVVDPDVRRRADLAHKIAKRNLHIEIYEDVAELFEYNPKAGMVLASNECGELIINAVRSGDFLLPVVLYGTELRAREISSALRAGVLDFLEYPVSDSDLSQELDRLIAEADEHLRAAQKASQATQLVARLSRREKQVLRAVALGGSNKSIAGELGISPRTVEIHRGSMMRKLNASSTADAARIAIYAGIDDDKDCLKSRRR